MICTTVPTCPFSVLAIVNELLLYKCKHGVFYKGVRVAYRENRAQKRRRTSHGPPPCIFTIVGLSSSYGPIRRVFCRRRPACSRSPKLASRPLSWTRPFSRIPLRYGPLCVPVF